MKNSAYWKKRFELLEQYWIERAKKSGYCTPDETFRLILLRVLEIPDKDIIKRRSAYIIL